VRRAGDEREVGFLDRALHGHRAELDAASGERAMRTVPLVSRSRRLTSATNSPG